MSPAMVATTGMRPWASRRCEDRRVDHLDVADEAERGVPGRGGDQVGVLARQPDRQRAVHVDGRHDLAVHLADEDHAGDLEGLGVGHPHPVAELGHLAEPRHQLADLGAAAVDDHRAACPTERMSTTSSANEASASASPARSPDASGSPSTGRQHVAAVLDDDDLAPEAQDVGQRLDQHGGRGRTGPSSGASRRRPVLVDVAVPRSMLSTAPVPVPRPRSQRDLDRPALPCGRARPRRRGRRPRPPGTPRRRRRRRSTRSRSKATPAEPSSLTTRPQ